MFCVGCTSLADRGMLPDIKARQVPDVNLGPEFVLIEGTKIAHNSQFKSLISSDGRAHLFLADRKKLIHHVEVSGNEVLLHEILGEMDGDTLGQALDAVEHPAGILRILAGDKQFIRPAPDQKWQEIKGNLCSQFLTTGDHLFCTFIANGEEIGAPTRRDWTVGWFILIPVAFWSDVIADKLVLAQESQNAWTIRAVFDPETTLSVRSDFMVGAVQDGSLHFFYRVSGGSRAFFIAFGAGGGGGWGGNTSAMEMRYARVQYDLLFPGNTNSGNQESQRNDTPISWEAVQGISLPPIPYIGDKNLTAYFLSGPLERHFTVNGLSGNLEGLVWIYNWRLDDGVHKTGVFDNPWIYVKLREGKWDPHFNIVTANDLPESGVRWVNDRAALIKNDSKGNNHILLIKTEGSWVFNNKMCYLLNTGEDWSVPLVLGKDLRIDSRRSLSIDETGKVFAVWENKSNQVVGRWISPNK